MTISDSPDWRSQEARMAKAKAHHERTLLIGQWRNEGHITVIDDESRDAAYVHLRIEDEVFADPRDRFPSVELIAKLQLAIHAGRSDRNQHIGELQRQWGDAVRKKFKFDYFKPWFVEEADVTATVKPRRPRP